MMIRVIRVSKELLPCVENAFIGTQCIVTLPNMCMVVHNLSDEGLLHRSKCTTGMLVANNSMDLLCIDFMKIDPLRESKEDISGPD